MEQQTVNKNQIFKWSLIGLGVIMVMMLFGSIISFSNDEVELRNRFTQKMDERTAFYDKMWKTLAQKSQIALKNDSSFANNVNAIMAGRKDAPGIFMKWVQESNPNANYEQVSLLYQDLSRAVEGQRDGFFMEEKMIQGVVMEHNNLLGKFPGSFMNIFFGREKLIYKPITSDRTDEVIKTGKDNDVNLF
jgi:hypothetical protein